MSEKISLVPKTDGFLLSQLKTNPVVLGKATRRGIRKCPKCGVYNGTRCISCKSCGLLLKTPKEKLPGALTPEVPTVEAVKLICPSNVHIYSVKTDPSENHRCLVHLPVIEGIESLQDEAEVSAIKRSTAMCYAAACRQTVVQLSSIYLNFNPCDHTSSILNCQIDAVPLEIKRGIVEALPIPDSIKQDIIQLISASEDPVVQRVLRDTMVVKCEDLYHPLGYLHFRITKPFKKSTKYKVLCECHVGLKPSVPKEKRFCIHFYLCVCAIASDNNIWSEFSSFMTQVLNFEEHITGDLEPNFKCDVREVSPKKPKIDNNDTKSQPVSCPTLQFDDWLASVTEQINQTMHYQFDGHPPPLMFHVPQAFFDILQNRITTGSKKKRLPNSVVAISRKTAPPIGVFSKYTYEITNILHVKRIFDSTKVPLEITRSFIDNKDGTFSPYKPEQVEGANILGNNQKVQNTTIKPAELKTFLKIGIMSVNQKEPTPFIIEWIPNILTQTHVGEMTIKFQYGHQKNGIIEKRNQTPATSERKSAT